MSNLQFEKSQIKRIQRIFFKLIGICASLSSHRKDDFFVISVLPGFVLGLGLRIIYIFNKR